MDENELQVIPPQWLQKDELPGPVPCEWHCILIIIIYNI